MARASKPVRKKRISSPWASSWANQKKKKSQILKSALGATPISSRTSLYFEQYRLQQQRTAKLARTHLTFLCPIPIINHTFLIALFQRTSLFNPDFCILSLSSIKWVSSSLHLRVRTKRNLHILPANRVRESDPPPNRVSL